MRVQILIPCQIDRGRGGDLRAAGRRRIPPVKNVAVARGCSGRDRILVAVLHRVRPIGFHCAQVHEDKREFLRLFRHRLFHHRRFRIGFRLRRGLDHRIFGIMRIQVHGGSTPIVVRARDFRAADRVGVPAVKGIPFPLIRFRELTVGIICQSRLQRERYLFGIAQPEIDVWTSACGREREGRTGHFLPIELAVEIILVGVARRQRRMKLAVEVIPAVERCRGVADIRHIIPMISNIAPVKIIDMQAHLSNLCAGGLGDLVDQHRVGVRDLLLGRVVRICRQREGHTRRRRSRVR